MKLYQPIAIVGAGGIFPGAHNLKHFWRNIVNAVNVSREIPAGRWPIDVQKDYASGKGVPDKVYSKHGCFVNEFSIDHHKLDIDHDFLAKLDPLFHIALYAGSEAFSEISTKKLVKDRIKVIIGNIVLPSQESSKLAMKYLGASFEEKVIGIKPTNDYKDVDPVSRFVAGLPGGVLAKALGFGGGSFTLDAACASSLYAISLAVDELLTGNADAVLAGGVSRPDCFYTQMGFSQLHALSPNGISAPFDKDANGLVVGEGAGMFMLKRLEDALEADDHIYGCIKGIGLSNDVDSSLLAPSSEGQLRAMRQAYDVADWSPSDVDLIECHATGTPVGDLVEFQSLKELWGKNEWQKGQCVIGSVKSNIGHLLTAAGGAALMKVIFALKENVLPPTANFNNPRSDIGIEESPFRLLKNSLSWNRRTSSTPRRAAVSAFGFGGINAHLLVEEWMPDGKKILQSNFMPKPALDIAITGMETHVGEWSSLQAFKERVFDLKKDEEIHTCEKNWWGTQKCNWFKKESFNVNNFNGYYINEYSVPVNRFRIPPKELKEMLPQQLLMLKVASQAIKDGRLSEKDRLNTAVIVGIALDLNTTNFHFRWMMMGKAKMWSKRLGIKIEEDKFEELISELMESAGPALTAGRTLGALGGVVASRIAREFRLGGPSFTVSNEECSGIRAVETAVSLLQAGKVKQAVVGAVDLAGDIRAVLSTHDKRKYSLSGTIMPFDENADGSLPADGAAAIILKPLEDAVKAGDRIYAVIRGIGSTCGGDFSKHIPSKYSYENAMKAAYRHAGVNQEEVDLIETHGSGLSDEDGMEIDGLLGSLKDGYGNNENIKACAISSVKADVGHSGAASGLISLVKGALSLYYEIIPGIRNLKKLKKEFANSQGKFYFPLTARYWLRNKADGPRRAGVSSISMDGNCSHIILEEYENDSVQKQKNGMDRACIVSEELFVVESDNVFDLKHGIECLQDFPKRFQGSSINTLAKLWWRQKQGCSSKKHALVLVAGNHKELNLILGKVHDRLESENGYETLDFTDDNRIYFTVNPIGPEGEIAFVYPGSGNHYSGMAQELLMKWPEIIRKEEDESFCLKNQFSPEMFWCGKPRSEVNHDKRGIMLAQVSFGCFVTDLLKSFNINPHAAIGYSLGESTSLLALKVWSDRDEMMRRMMESNLFVSELAGDYNAARAAWGLSENEMVDWEVGLIVCQEDVVRRAIEKRERVYLLIVNTLKECVIGGHVKYVKDLVDELGCDYLPLKGVTIAHCEIILQVINDYRKLHLFDEIQPVDVKFYSGAWERLYTLSSENSAESIVSHAVKGFNFPRLIENAYNDGIRIFIEIGPGFSCCRMIDEILDQRPHVSVFANSPGKDEVLTILKLLARLIAERVNVNLDFIYGDDENNKLIGGTINSEKNDDSVVIQVGSSDFNIPELLTLYKEENKISCSDEQNYPYTGGKDRNEYMLNVLKEQSFLVKSIEETNDANAKAHESFLLFSNKVKEAVIENTALQFKLINSMEDNNTDSTESVMYTSTKSSSISNVAFDRDKCLEFAVGKISNVLGDKYAEIDNYPTRVRLPDEPMMFVDRIVLVEGEPCSLNSGRVITEHDIENDSWYLDCDRIPTCVAVEAGQADLFLSGYLGIDFKTNGLSVYRLLDAAVTFYRELPGPGEVIRYDIRIEHFFRHGKTYLFRFCFEATVNGEPLLSMKDGCAGFFSAKELNSGKGIIVNDTKSDNGIYGKNKPVINIVPMGVESYSHVQLDKLRAGDLVGSFGPLFKRLNIRKPSVIPGDMMKLVHRITEIDPIGGTFGKGFVRGEADIHKDDWFLVCHFVDDKVMPGTLMYECCLHTLRVYLLRMGWVGEYEEVIYQPVPGIASRLKCRGQVIESTKMVAYEISIKEIGYRPEPYAICDALMFADTKAIVKIEDMSLRISGLNETKINNVWGNSNQQMQVGKKVLFDYDRILTFAIGKPSDAFGKPYTIFDRERRIARLPGPSYLFLDRIVEIDAEAWKMVGGGQIVAEYDVPIDAWYFKKNRQKLIPFAVLLEIALQPCGWLAAYVGSALTSKEDLSFRNLGGTGVVSKPVFSDIGTLSTEVKMTKVAKSAGMIIQHYDFHVRNNGQTVYKGNTYFGFFTKEALSNQIGIRDAVLYKTTESEAKEAKRFDYPTDTYYPEKMMRMVDKIDLFSNDGGSFGLGFVMGSKQIDPKEWFFKAHFFQDPVWPGSLGLESFLQILKVAAVKRWGVDSNVQMEAVAINEEHEWIYRGQVLPTDKNVSVQAVVTEVDDNQKLLKADGFLGVDGRIIYQINNFAVRLKV